MYFSELPNCKADLGRVFIVESKSPHGGLRKAGDIQLKLLAEQEVLKELT